RAAYEIARREKGTLHTEGEQGDLHPEEQLELPYLPDPLAAGVVFFDLPGMPPGDAFVVKFGDLSWSNARPFRLVLAEGSGAPQWDETTHVLRVELPQSASAVIRAASLFGDDLSIMGVLDWCAQSLTAAQFDVVLDAAERGDNWFITPSQDLTLVHATQQPLAEPIIQELQIQRQPRATFITLFGIVELHAQSTEKVDLLASWTEWIDDPALPG